MSSSPVFISYSRKDAEFVAKLCGQFRRVKCPFWADTSGIRAGQNWTERIDSALQSAALVVAVVSPQSRNSLQVTYEWAFARGAGKTVIPVKLRNVDLPAQLAALQWIDFTPKRKRWAQLVAAIDAHKADVAANAPRPQIRAEFELVDERPRMADGDYRINLWIEGAPTSARRAKYSLDRELFAQPVWSEGRPENQFRTWMQSSGDAVIHAVIYADADKQAIHATLFDALQKSHADDKRGAVRKALDSIRDN